MIIILSFTNTLVYSFKYSMEPQSTANKSSKRQLSSDCNTLELTNGKATSLLGLSDNQISTNSYLSNNVVIRLLFKLLNPCPLSLIITIVVVALLPKSKAYPLWMYIAEFGMILLLLIVKEVYFDMMRRRADEKVNKSNFLNQDSKIYRDGQELTGLCWGDIRQGDILYLEKGEKAPADLLVLDTQHIEDREAVVYIDSRSITGRVTVERKKACYLTQVTSRSAIKRNWDKYKKEYLTGKLKYELPNADMEDFLGYLKLVKDPKTSLITFENFISRESIIKTCWIYALVLHAGMNCKIMRHIGERNRNHKFFQNYIDRIFAVCFAINIILGLPYALVTLGNEFLSNMETSVYHLLIFSVILPHFLYFGNGLLLLYFSFKNNIDAEIINFSSIISLGSIDFAMIAYNGVLSSGKMIADEIITSSSLYDFREECQVNLRGSRRNGSMNGNGINKDKMLQNGTSAKNKRSNKFFMSICSSGTNGNTPQEKQFVPGNEFDTYFLDDDYKQDTNSRMYTGMHSVNPAKFKMQLEPLRISKQKLSTNIKNEQEQSMELVKAFGMCHQAILKSIDSQDIKFQANSRIYAEEVLLRLVNGIGVHVASQIDSRSKKEMGLKFKILDANKEMFFSRKINNFLVERKIFSVVVREEGFQERIIYCKGSPEDMFEKLRDKELKKNILENKLSLFKNTKAEIIVYGKRILSNSQYETYDAEFTKLKMSSNVTQKDIDEFSSKFEKDLQFVCMVGLSSQKSQPAKQMTTYLTEKGIKMCIFTNNNAEIQSLKSLLSSQQNDNKLEYIELEGITVEEIIYNLNSITRKLSSEKEFIFSLVVGPKCWKHLKIHQSLMQHFLFAAYYSQNILTHGFTPQQKAEITEKMKTGFNRNHTLMSIGSSYSDLLFENYSNVSLIINSSQKQRIRSDIPSDIRAPTISSLKNIIQLGSWATNAYNYLIDASIYRSILVGTVAFTIETIVYSQQGTSYNLDGTLTALYIVVYGTIETLFTIKIEQRKGKLQIYQKVKVQEYWIKFITNIIEAVIHGATISIIVFMTLPNARFNDGRLFPVESIHYCIYFLLITVSIFRHVIQGECSKMAIFILSAVSFTVLLGVLWILAAFSTEYNKIARQMYMVYTVYDSAIMQINVVIFSLACSLFISETRKKGMVSMLANYYLNLKKGQGAKSKQLLSKDINPVDLVKHLFVDVENIEQSIQQLVGAEFDTNQLKINSLIEIKKAEHRIKNEFNNVSLNLSRFKITIVSMVILLLSEIIYQSLVGMVSAQQLVPLFTCLVITIIGFIWLLKNGDDLGRKYYQGAELCLEMFCLIIIIYEGVSADDEEHFLLTCCSFIIFTQLIGVRLQVIFILCVCSIITSIVISSIRRDPESILPLQIVLGIICSAVNIAVLYGSTFDSKKNFILRQQIQMQTNQTNDIWTILVPEFVRNFFAETGEQGGQYRQNSVAILFCYVCNFDSIIEQQGRNVVRILDDLYREFDKLCSSFAVQKIETVGYTYMAATGIKKIESQIQNQMIRRNKVERLLGMAQQMLDKTRMFKWGHKKNKDLEIKIGIHVGEVVVGVIGKHKKQFSLIGTNVNTTSRHGSTGHAGSITLSREAKSELHFPQEAFIKKDVYMKGLCKDLTQNIPVYTLKIEEVARRTNTKSNGHRLKFKELVMKIIRSQRLSDQKSSDDGHLLANIVNLNQPLHIGGPHVSNASRDVRRRTTCRGLQNNFNKIEEMKNRQDELKCYSSLLEFDSERAREHFSDSYPGKSEQDLQLQISKQEELEKEYHLDLQKNRAIRDKIFVVILIALNCAYLVSNIVTKNSSDGQIAVRVIGILLLLLIYWCVRNFHKHDFFKKIVLVVFIYLLSVEKYDEVVESSAGGRIFSHFYVMIIITMFSGISGVRFVYAVCMVGLAIIAGIIATILQQELEINAVYQWFYIVMVLIRKYAFQKESIINFRQGRKTAQISNELSKIVSQLLPKHAYEKLKTQNFENRLELTDLFEQCTILFADIKGFTEFSDRPQNRKEPENVVRMLRSLFQEFDVLCTQKNVYKVYTIGDCYVVLGFTNCYDRNPIKQAENVLSFAFDMLKKIDEVKKEKPSLECLNMRIGIHTGTIIGGIVGTEIVRYDIYGSDVVVANKFEESGKIGEVHISEQTKKLLDQLQKKPYSENNIYPSEKVEVKKLNISYGGYFIKRGNLS